MYFIDLVVIYILTEQFLNWNYISREIGNILLDVLNILDLNVTLCLIIYFGMENDKKCHDQ